MESSKKLIFFPLQTQYSNLGDQLINKVLLDKLQTYGDLIVDDRGVPEWYIEKLGLLPWQRSSYYGKNLNYLILQQSLKNKFSRQFKLIYLVYHPGHRYGDRTLSKTLHWFRSMLINNSLFYLLGVRMCSFGISIGPFSPALKILEKWKSNFMYFYSVRDSISETYARSIGIQKVQRFPDIAWLMKIKPEQQINNAAQIDGKYIIFSFRSATNAYTDSTAYGNQLCAILDQIFNLFCLTLNQKLVISYQVEMDYEFCQYLESRYKDRGNVILLKEKVEADTMYSLYHNASMVFSNRLHVLLFSIVCNALPIAVVDAKKHDKVVGIFQDANFHELIIDINQDDFPINDLQELANQSSNIKKKVNSYYEQTQILAENLIEQVIQMNSLR
jgi:polysaccharide pyruvyl transferase WcaK-like protein